MDDHFKAVVVIIDKTRITVIVEDRRRIGSRDDDEDEVLNQSPSHLIPMIYPFHYPPYPYPYPYTFTMPSLSGPHAPHAQTQPHPLSPSETPNEQTQPRDQRGLRSKANQGHPSLSHPVFQVYSPGIPHPGYTALAHSTPTMMVPQVYLLHSTSYGQLQPVSPVQNGSGVIGEGRTPRRAGGGGRIGPEVVLDDVDSTQQ